MSTLGFFKKTFLAIKQILISFFNYYHNLKILWTYLEKDVCLFRDNFQESVEIQYTLSQIPYGESDLQK